MVCWHAFFFFPESASQATQTKLYFNRSAIYSFLYIQFQFFFFLLGFNLKKKQQSLQSVARTLCDSGDTPSFWKCKCSNSSAVKALLRKATNKVVFTKARRWTATLYGTVNVRPRVDRVCGGSGWHSCGPRPVSCSTVMNDAACDSRLSVSAHGCLYCRGNLFFLFFLQHFHGLCLSFHWGLFPARGFSMLTLV